MPPRPPVNPQFLEYFFTEADAAFFASLGLNCIRLPINYRHFEDDMAPGVFKPEGLKHLDRVIDLCAKHGIYTVIDLHAAPGGQNVDWHADAGSNQALCECLPTGKRRGRWHRLHRLHPLHHPTSSSTFVQIPPP